jgi:acyl-coenzyme A thioesterase PaaI-like protein
MKRFETNKKENLKFKIKRFLFNFFPAYRRTGARICFISDDWKEMHIKLGLKWTTRNYVGSVFGGSIYGALDPIYMVQLINILGDRYVVWDKVATIKFIRPIKQEVFARFLISENLITEIKKEIELNKEMEIELSVQFNDANKTTYAEVIKKLYIADKEYYNKKKQHTIKNKHHSHLR